jgi:hypothetical protein
MKLTDLLDPEKYEKLRKLLLEANRLKGKPGRPPKEPEGAIAGRPGGLLALRVGCR